MIDSYYLADLAKSAGIDRYSILREYLQLLFLDELYQSRTAAKIIFKGGTALKMLFNSPRFSEDLDFTTNLNQSKIDDLVNQTVVNINHEAPGIIVKNIKSIACISKKIFFPTEISPMPLTIKLDFSQRESALTDYQNTLNTNLPVFPQSLIHSLAPEEILAEKIRAILTRSKGRDIYDLWFLVKKGVKFNQKLIASKFKIYQEKFDPQSLIEKIKKFDQKHLEQDLKKFLPLKNRQIIPQLKKIILAELAGMLKIN